MRRARTGTEDSAGPPHYVGPLFSGANAGSTLRPRPGQVTAKRGDARNGK